MIAATTSPTSAALRVVSLPFIWAAVYTNGRVRKLSSHILGNGITTPLHRLPPHFPTKTDTVASGAILAPEVDPHPAPMRTLPAVLAALMAPLRRDPGFAHSPGPIG